MDEEMRSVLEECVQQFFENPEQWETKAKEQMKMLGIQPTLDGALALFWGLTYGTVRTRIWAKAGAITTEDMLEITQYVLKEWPKLKEHYIARRLF